VGRLAVVVLAELEETGVVDGPGEVSYVDGGRHDDYRSLQGGRKEGKHIGGPCVDEGDEEGYMVRNMAEGDCDTCGVSGGGHELSNFFFTYMKSMLTGFCWLRP